MQVSTRRSMPAWTMSSETSTDAGLAGHPLAEPAGERPARHDAGFQPWQLFTLAGLVAGAVVAFLAGDHPHSVRIALILTIFAAAAVGLGFLRTLAPFAGSVETRGPQIVGGRTRAALEREKTLVLRSIKELEFDHAMGKVSDRDFAEMSTRLRARAGRLLRQLDAGVAYREEIAREIERRLASAPSATASTVDEGPATTEAAAPRTCSCGSTNEPDARFCKSCGTRLAD
jgi:hypothetical protein